jgi:hypothetical protein
MSADELRRAAETERADARMFPTAAHVHLALADLFDRHADEFQRTDYGRALTPVEEAAVTLARLINGGAS